MADTGPQKQGVVPENCKVLKEGQASVLLHGNKVFYNEAQCTNRDLSTAVLRTFLPLLVEDKKQGALKKKRPQQQHKGKRQHERQQQQQQQEGKGSVGQQEATPDQQTSQQQEQQQGHQQASQEQQSSQQPQQQPQQQDTQGVTNEQQPSAPAKPSTSAPEQQQQQQQQQQSQEQQQQQLQEQKGQQQPKDQNKGAVILEGLAATGLRSIRYALEVPGVKRVDANDLDPAVCESMRRNVAFNGAEAEQRIRVLSNDARIIMMQSPNVYDVVDLDPYGTPAQLLDTAVQSVREGGLLCVTATDMANLCGNNSETCWSNYGAYPIHRPFCHEMALRILLACIESHAGRYKRYIKPIISMSIDFYIRVFVRVYSGAGEVKEAPCRLAYVWQSAGCDSFWLQHVGQKKVNDKSVKYMPNHGPTVPSHKCPETGSSYLMGGPIWVDPIHDQSFVKTLISDMDRDKSRYAQFTKIKGMLTSVADELPDMPLYYNLHDLCKTVKAQSPKLELFKSAIINAGYRVSGSHANPLAVKTDAPSEVIWDIIRCWIKDHPVNIKDSNSYAGKLLAKQPTLVANFSRAQGALKKDDTRRFVPNPANWGPKTKHGRPPIQHNLPTKADRAREQQQQQQQQQPPLQQQQQQSGEQLLEACNPDGQGGPIQQQPRGQSTSSVQQGEAQEQEGGGPAEKKQKIS